MKNKKYSKGFTLVELLVVIAIIGILAAIVLVSISGSRRKAQIAAFKSEVDSARTALLASCYQNTTNTLVAPAASPTTTWTVAAGFSCGPSGAGTFTATGTFVPSTSCTAIITVNTTMNSVVYSAACNTY